MWPFGEGKKKTDMSAKSRITCYNNRDAYFECMGNTAPASRPPSVGHQHSA